MTPTREEIIAEIYRLATEKGIDPAVFLQIVEGESSLNPAAVGDKGQSFGLAQLYMGGGLGNTYEQQTGTRPDNPADWKQHLAFMAQQATSGGKGWEPWHASARLGIEPQHGLPGGPAAAPAAAAPVSRGRRGQAMLPSQVIPGQPAPNTGLMAELNKIMAEKDKPQATLGSKLGEALGLDYSNKKTLGQMAYESLGNAFGSTDEKDKAVKAATKGVNEFAPVSVAEQMAKKKRPTPGTSLASLFMGPQSTQTAQAQPTAGSSLFKMLGFG